MKKYKYYFYNYKRQEQSYKGAEFGHIIEVELEKNQLECYYFPMLNVIYRGAMKKMTIGHIQKDMRKEFKYFTMEKKSTDYKRKQ